MPVLYCEKDGKENSARLASWSLAEFEGDPVLVTKGKMIIDGYVCDRCNVKMKKGDIGYLINHWLGEWMEEFFNYDFGYERNYLDFKKDDTIVYGWDWES